MNGFHHPPFRRPPEPLWTHNSAGEEAPPGTGFNAQGELVQVGFAPYAQGPQPPWGMGNPDYESLYKGDSTIERQPNAQPGLPAGYGRDPMAPPGFEGHAQYALVRNDAYRKADDADEPTQDNGIQGFVSVGGLGDIARQAWRSAKSLIGYCEVPSPDNEYALATVDPTQPSPLNVPPVQATIHVPPIGGCVSVARLRFGHLGVQNVAMYDVPPAQIIRVPFGGSIGILTTFLAPKYFTNHDVGGTRTYLVFPGGPTLTSVIWNTIDQNTLLQNGFVNPNKVPFAGYFAESNFSNTQLSQPLRRFYGSVACTNIPSSQVTVCPVAWYASQVTLLGNRGLQFLVNGLTSGGGVTQTWGPFLANTTQVLPAGAVSITVFDAVGIGPGVGVNEFTFELDYTLSF